MMLNLLMTLMLANPLLLPNRGISLWSVTGAALTNGNDPTITFSPAPAVGDLVLVCGGFTDSADGAEILTAGYTEVLDGDLTTTMSVVCAYKVLTTAETTVQGEGGGSASDSSAYVAMTFKGVDPVTPIDVTTVTSFSAAAAAPTCSTITPVTPGARVVCACGASVFDATHTATAGYTQAGGQSANDNEDGSANMEIKDYALAPDASGSAAWSAWSGAYVCAHIALRPAA